jgi:hypothetical protein
MSNDSAVREHLIELLQKSHARVQFEQAVTGIPFEKMGVRPAGIPHSPWEVLEHLREAQLDILEFTESADYKPRKWPEDYWPRQPQPASAAEWQQSVKRVLADRDAFIRLLQDPKRDLFQPFPWGDGQTLMREALLIADHNAYHIGEMVVIRRALEIWP